eukprot:Hpha_TRINITY_DN15920_c0_g1::TRINITY_DN15920_c0_g1_i3::g.72244::m.72244
MGFRQAVFARTRLLLRAMPEQKEIQAFIVQQNEQYDRLHKSFEENFWAVKMALKGHSSDELTKTKTEYESYLRDKANLQKVRSMMDGATPEQMHILKVMERTFLCYLIEDPEAAALKDKITDLESKLEEKRNTMKLGYKDPKTGELQEASSVLLSTKMATSDDEAVRKACYEGLSDIPKFIAEDFAEIVRLRIRLAKMLGQKNFYDYKVNASEGFGVDRLFEILDGLEQDSRELNVAARKRIAEEKGEWALEPWNTGYALAGSLTKEQDPYFQFTEAVDAWARSFAALGIQYKGATMNLDLVDRKGKYSNGFCHWPVCAYTKADGSWQPSVTNFTSLATPGAIGSGHRGLVTLMHEGGHAAHFANVTQPSPFFAQERSPMSVAYAENQSMFLDSLVGDGDWLARYSRDSSGKPMPLELIERSIRQTHPYKVRGLRGMIAVCYLEKALYELDESEVTAERLLKIGEEIELKITGGRRGLPLLAIPHIISDESSCYYQGYVLADMSVYQTREHFKRKYGPITDEPRVGKDLTEIYWKPGNGEGFLDLVEKMTGKPLTGEDWINDLKKTVEEKVESQKELYAKGLEAGPKIAPGDQVDLGMESMRLVHGDEVIAETAKDGGVPGACAKYSQWIQKTFPPGSD